MAFINPPAKKSFLFSFANWLVRRITGKDLLPAQLLAWYPKAAVSSAVMEGLIAHQDGALNKRMLKIVRMTASFSAGCPFCMDMNSTDWDQFISLDELRVLQGSKPADEVSSLSSREKLAVEYTRRISGTPLEFPRLLIAELTAQFTEREIVILAVTAAQVNYWARLIQALGCPPAGFNENLFFLDDWHVTK